MGQRLRWGGPVLTTSIVRPLSALPHRWILRPLRGSAVLRQQPLRNCHCPRTLFDPRFDATPSDPRVDLQNGNLTNTPHLHYYLDHYAHRHINTSSDSELLLNLLADALQKTGKFRIDADDIFRAVREVMQTTSGAYACTGMIAGFGVIGFRDPNGIRPLGWGRRKSEQIEGGWDYLMASESVVCDALGFGEWKDVNPGESRPDHFHPSIRR